MIALWGTRPEILAAHLAHCALTFQHLRLLLVAESAPRIQAHADLVWQPRAPFIVVVLNFFPDVDRPGRSLCPALRK
jgi:hypothetical protein